MKHHYSPQAPGSLLGFPMSWFLPWLPQELKIKQLKSHGLGEPTEAVEALAMAQEAGETLLELSQKIGPLAAQLGVREGSVAIRFTIQQLRGP